MDSLDHLAASGAELFDRVDRTLSAAGAPDDHRIWPLLANLRALPGDALAVVVGLRAAPLLAAATAMRELIPRYDETRTILVDRGRGLPPGGWEGAAAEAFGAHQTALAAHLGGGAESLTGRLEHTAAYPEAVADWVYRTRGAVARTLAEVLGSAEAVALRAGGAGRPAMPAALAAAEIGARLLATVAQSYDQADTLLRGWTSALAELDYRAPVDSVGRLDAITRMIF